MLGGLRRGCPSSCLPGVGNTEAVSTKDQTLSAALHGEALLTAKRPELQPLIDHLAEVAQAATTSEECAGVIAGSWFADAARRGEDLIAAGLLMLAGHVDLDELDKWVRVGWERRRGASDPYPDGEG
jgi:hypothetical protein